MLIIQSSSIKIAAPASPRSKWNRFWTRVQNPISNAKGKDADTRFEMDAILESMMNVKRGADQVKNSITQLQHSATQFPSIAPYVQKLHTTDWKQLRNTIVQIEQLLTPKTAQVNLPEDYKNDPLSAPTVPLQNKATPENNPNSNISELIQSLKRNMAEVDQQILTIQQHMYNVRQRDAIKGGKGSNSAVKEYSDMDRALNKLYANPLDEKSLYYAQKMQGQLEDALNMRVNTPDTTFEDWANQTPQEFSPVSIDNQSTITQTQSPSVNPQSMEEASKIIAESLAKDADEATMQELVKMLKEFQGGRMTPETQQKINMLADALSNAQPLQSSVPNANPATPQSATQTSPTSTPPNNSAFGSDANWGDMNTASNTNLFTKLAQTVAIYDQELADLLKEYINDEEQFPSFPQKTNILQENFQENKGITYSYTQRKWLRP